MARRGYVSGTAAALGVGLPAYQGGTSSGGLLLLLVGAYLLIAYVTGRLGWLTNALSDVFSTYNAGGVSPSPSPGAAPAPSTAPLPSQRDPNLLIPAYVRPRTYPVGAHA